MTLPSQDKISSNYWWSLRGTCHPASLTKSDTIHSRISFNLSVFLNTKNSVEYFRLFPVYTDITWTFCYVHGMTWNDARKTEIKVFNSTSSSSSKSCSRTLSLFCSMCSASVLRLRRLKFISAFCVTRYACNLFYDVTCRVHESLFWFWLWLMRLRFTFSLFYVNESTASFIFYGTCKLFVSLISMLINSVYKRLKKCNWFTWKSK